MQLSEMVFTLNSIIQPNETGSPISRFYARDVRYLLPNLLNRNLNRTYLMENRRNVHLKKVARKGRNSNEIFSVGERCLVQNVVTRLWDIIQ